MFCATNSVRVIFFQQQDSLLAYVDILYWAKYEKEPFTLSKYLAAGPHSRSLANPFLIRTTVIFAFRILKVASDTIARLTMQLAATVTSRRISRNDGGCWGFGRR